VFKTGFEMVMVSLVACGVGIALGKLLNSLLVTGI
jgi:hypothetical protein